MKVKDESKNAGLKLNIHNMKIMASHLITSWQIHGKNFETVTDFFSWDLKSLWTVTAVTKLKGSFSLEEKQSQT